MSKLIRGWTRNRGSSYDLGLRRTSMRPAMSKSTNSPPVLQGNISRGETWFVLSLLVTVCTFLCIGGRSWNANALVVERTRLTTTWPTPGFSNNGFEDAHTVFLDVEVKNKTGRDIVLPRSIKLRETTRFSPSLKLTEFGLHGPIILRAGGTTRVRVNYDLFCKADRIPKDCVRQALGNVDQLIIFDGEDRYEIRVPLADAIDTYLTSPN